MENTNNIELLAIAAPHIDSEIMQKMADFASSVRIPGASISAKTLIRWASFVQLTAAKSPVSFYNIAMGFHRAVGFRFDYKTRELIDSILKRHFATI